MEDINQPNYDQKPKHKKSGRSKTITLNRNLFFIGIAVITLVLVFFLGSSYGSNKQEKSNKESSSSSRPASSSDRWTSVGEVVSVSDSEIKVKDSRDEEKTAVINDKTKIVNRKGETVKATDIKKDQRVIVSGEKDKDKLLALRIRVQQ